MGVIAKGISRGCQGVFNPVFLGYPLSVFNKNSTLNPMMAAVGAPRNLVRGSRTSLDPGKVWLEVLPITSSAGVPFSL